MARELKYFIVETDGPVVIWKYNNPPKNLMTADIWDDFDYIVEEFEADPNLRAAILTSALDDVFIQHFDVEIIVERSDAMRAAPSEQAIRTANQVPPPRALHKIGPKPIICAINAWVSGGGCETILGCDFRLMSRKATIGLPEVTVGIHPPTGAQRLPRLIGIPKALEMILLGKIIDADEAERIGMVHRACEPEELMPMALDLARKLAAQPPLAIALAKRAIYEGMQMPLEQGLALGRLLSTELIKSDDANRLMKEYVAGGQNREDLRRTW